MQEFESISASSYDPSALATKLTAKAGEGWSVVAIVPTGGDVTAFLSRDKADDSDSSSAPGETKPAVDTKVDDKDDAETTKAAETIDAISDDKPDDEPSSLLLPAKSETSSETQPESKSEPVTEPSGWAIAPEPATPSSTPGTPGSPGTGGTAQPTGVQPSITIQPATTYEPATTPGYQPAPAPTPTPASTPAASTPAASTPAATTPAAATPAPATPEPAAAPAVPAGWYADPAGRFELRYWDGSTWTEHVSRSGQQFTDPPVA